MHDIIDDLEEFTDLPDKFSDLLWEHYPTVTYRKFLMMLDGTFQTSFLVHFVVNSSLPLKEDIPNRVHYKLLLN
jgi:hypothetical protein